MFPLNPNSFHYLFDKFSKDYGKKKVRIGTKIQQVKIETSLFGRMLGFLNFLWAQGSLFNWSICSFCFKLFNDLINAVSIFLLVVKIFKVIPDMMCFDIFLTMGTHFTMLFSNFYYLHQKGSSESPIMVMILRFLISNAVL